MIFLVYLDVFELYAFTCEVSEVESNIMYVILK